MTKEISHPGLEPDDRRDSVKRPFEVRKGFKRNPFKRSAHKAGLPPGTLVHVGERRAEKVKVTLIEYDETIVREQDDIQVEDCFPFKEKPTVTWLNVSGIHEVRVVERIGEVLGLHPLLLEDILHTEQRPKLEDYKDYLFFTMNMLTYSESDGKTVSEQVSLVLGPHFVLSFQETEKDVFDPVRQRIRSAKGRIRKLGSDYLAYTLIDTVVDNYFVILENIGERIDLLQERVILDPAPDTLNLIHSSKRDLIYLRRSVWPLREAISGLERAEPPLITASVKVYMRDVYDHTIQVIDTLETYRDILSGTLDVYLSSVSKRMNEVMKVLTVVATIFIPLTFLTGVYGMNFKHMPELGWPWGYFGLWGVMILIAAFMLGFFKRRGWL